MSRVQLPRQSVQAAPHAAGSTAPWHPPHLRLGLWVGQHCSLQREGPGILAWDDFFFLFPFPSPFLFLPSLYLIYVSTWLVETRSQRGCGPEQRHPVGVRAQQGGLGEEWLPDRPTRQADPACLPDTQFPRIQLGDTYRREQRQGETPTSTVYETDYIHGENTGDCWIRNTEGVGAQLDNSSLLLCWGSGRPHGGIFYLLGPSTEVCFDHSLNHKQKLSW